MLTKKDHKAIAEVIRKRYHVYDKPDIITKEQYICSYIAQDLSWHFAEKNPHFDRQKFLDACGIS